MHQDKLGVIIITNILYKMKWKHKAPPPVRMLEIVLNVM